MEITKESVISVFIRDMHESIKDIEFIEEGIETCAKIESETGTYVMKIHESDVYDSPSGFLAGERIMSKVQNNLDIPIPELYVVRDSYGSPFNVPYYIMNFVEGDIFELSSENIGSEDHVQLLYECGEFLGKLHSLDCDTDTFGWLGLQDSGLETFEKCETNEEFMKFMFEEDFIKYIQNTRFSKSIEQIKNINNHILSTVDLTGPQVYCHWDLKYENMIIDSSQDTIIQGVLDWENPIVSSPLFNIIIVEDVLLTRHSRLEEYDESLIQDLRDVFREGYKSTSPYEIDFDSNFVQKKIIAYEYYTILTGMKNFELWYGSKSEDEKEEIADLYYELLDDFETYFCEDDYEFESLNH